MTKLSLKIGDKEHVFGTKGTDVSAGTLISAFFGVMVSATFIPSTVLNCMKDFAEEMIEAEYGRDEIN